MFWMFRPAVLQLLPTTATLSQVMMTPGSKTDETQDSRQPWINPLDGVKKSTTHCPLRSSRHTGSPVWIVNGVSGKDLGPRQPSMLMTRLRQRLGSQEILIAEDI